MYYNPNTFWAYFQIFLLSLLLLGVFGLFLILVDLWLKIPFLLSYMLSFGGANINTCILPVFSEKLNFKFLKDQTLSLMFLKIKHYGKEI